MPSSDYPTFYKYRSWRRTKEIITEQSLYFAKLDRFNDPFEGRFRVSCEGTLEEKKLKYCNRLRIQNQDLSENEARGMAEDFFSPRNAQRVAEWERSRSAVLQADVLEKTGVFALCAVPDDIVMWGHYSESHTGTCMEFRITDESQLSFFYRRPGRMLSEVVYQERFPEWHLYRGAHEENVNAVFFTKAKHWEYEKEWRIVDWDRGPGLYQFPAKLLTGVIMGCSMPVEHRRELQEILDRYPSPVALYGARPKEDEFRLEITRIM